MASVARDCLEYLTEEAFPTAGYVYDSPRLKTALEDLESVFPSTLVNDSILGSAREKFDKRLAKHNAVYNQTVSRSVAVRTLTTNTGAASVYL